MTMNVGTAHKFVRIASRRDLDNGMSTRTRGRAARRAGRVVIESGSDCCRDGMIMAIRGVRDTSAKHHLSHMWPQYAINVSLIDLKKQSTNAQPLTLSMGG
jgi:hypothetical protein